MEQVVLRSAELVSTGLTRRQFTDGSAEDLNSTEPSVPYSYCEPCTNTTNASGLSAGWIVAIVALILLAVSCALNIFQLCWRRRSRGVRGARRPDSEYYEITKPPRARRPLSSYRYSRHHY